MKKGGAYQEDKLNYVRKGPLGSTLYELSIEKDLESTTYTLDFSKAGSIISGVMRFTKNDSIIDKYTTTFINAFDIQDGPGKEFIKEIITKLFDGGVAGAKKRTLMITEFKQNQNIKLNLKENDAVILEGSVVKPTDEPKFEKFLISLKDDLMPL